MTIRFRNHMATYLVKDPEVIETEKFGPAFDGLFKMEGYAGGWETEKGTFWLDTATLIEPVPEQLELEAA